MNKKIQRGFMLKKEDNDMAVKRIISFFQTERDEEIGVIAAQQILDFFLEDIGASIYNKAVEDSNSTLRDQFEEMDYKLNMLKKDTKK